MELIELRVLFVAGLLVLGAFTALAGALLGRLTERLLSHRGYGAGTTEKGIATPAGRHGALGHAGR
jgi:hypothetical protein